MKNTRFSVLALVNLLQAIPSLADSCAPINNVKVTFYGWPDNSPPGADNAFDCGRGNGPDGEPIAGGTGTYNDPISFATATDNNNFAKCGIIYVPSLRKYFRNEDDCAECKTDWDSSQEYHVDLWTGSNTQGGGQNQITCEDNLPGGQLTIINNAPDGLPVDTTELYDVTSNTCNSGTTYPVGDASNLCSGGSSGGPSGGSSVSQSQSSQTSTTLATVTTTSSAGDGSSPSTTAPGSLNTPEASCTWPGHCLGDPCQTYNDCDSTNVCGPNGVCVPLSS